MNGFWSWETLGVVLTLIVVFFGGVLAVATVVSVAVGLLATFFRRRASPLAARIYSCHPNVLACIDSQTVYGLIRRTCTLGNPDYG